jgi:hypothetical protein
MTTQIKINSPEEVRTLIDETKAYQEAERQTAKEAARPTPSTKIPTHERIEIRDGEMVSRSGKATSVKTGQPLPAGYVKLSNGMEAELSAVKAAGLESMIVGDDAQSFKEGSPQAQAEAPDMDKDGQDTDSAPALEGVTEAERDQITKADDAMKQGREAIGTSAVEALQHDAIASGMVPSELPDGVTAEMVNAVVDGYTTQANVVLRETGANVEAMTAMLTENELKDARVAVFKSDDAKLKSLGRRAAQRLQSLPNDPVLFAEMTASWPAEVKMTKRNGTIHVSTPNWQMPWAEAVRAGKIKL